MSTATGLSSPERPATTPTFQAPSTGRKIKNNLATFLVGLAFVIALIPLVWVLATVVVRGVGAIVSADWWGRSLSGVLPESYAGGVYHAIYGTLVQAALAAVHRRPDRHPRRGLPRRVRPRAAGEDDELHGGHPRRSALDRRGAVRLRGVRSRILGFPQSAFMVSLALVLLMLPVVIRNTEEMLRLVPDELREAAYALGIPKWKTILRIVLPTALSGIVTGVMLALARVMGETAPVLVLVGYSQSINFDAFSGNMASLPLLMFSELVQPGAVRRSSASGAPR